MDYSNVYKKVASSVVNVIQVNPDNSCRDFATGVLIGDGSKVLTCSHCVNSHFRNAIYTKSTNQFQVGTIFFNDTDNDIAEGAMKIGSRATI